MTIIFMLTLYPVAVIMYFVMKGAGKGANGYCFGAGIKAEWLEDEEVRQCREDYRKKINRQFAILALIPFVTFAIPSFSICLTIWMIWMLAVIASPSVYFAHANHRIREIKRERGWSEVHEKVMLTEMQSAGEVRRTKLLPFLPPILISIFAAGWSIYSFAKSGLAVLGIMTAIIALITVLIYAVAVWMDQQKIEVVSSDSDVNLNYGRAKKNIWKNMWLMCAWANTAYVVVTAWAMDPERLRADWMLWGCIIVTVVLLGLMVFAWSRINRIDKRYADRKDIITDADSDDNWIGGIIYYNKNDRHSMVNMRYGIGTTMNMATPMGKGLMIFAAATLLVIPIMCVWCMLEEFTPIRLSVKNEMLVAEHLNVDYTIPFDDMDKIELIEQEELPRLSKVAGTGMDQLYKGTFHIRNEGNCEVFLNPQNHIFIRIEAEGVVYYMSGTDDEDTQNIYERLEML